MYECLRRCVAERCSLEASTALFFFWLHQQRTTAGAKGCSYGHVGQVCLLLCLRAYMYQGKPASTHLSWLQSNPWFGNTGERVQDLQDKRRWTLYVQGSGEVSCITVACSPNDATHDVPVAWSCYVRPKACHATKAFSYLVKQRPKKLVRLLKHINVLPAVDQAEQITCSLLGRKQKLASAHRTPDHYQHCISAYAMC